MRYILFSVLLLSVACDIASTKEFDSVDPATALDCEVQRHIGSDKPTTPDGGVEWVWYNFMRYDFTCQEPLAEEFLLNYASFPESLPVVHALEFAQEAWMGHHVQRSFETSLELYITLDDSFFAGEDEWSVVIAAETLDIVSSKPIALAQQNLFDNTNMSCDIIVALNDTDGNSINWTTNAIVGPDEVNLQNVLMHEIGHCIGMDHPDSGFGTGTIMRKKVAPGDDQSFLPPVDRDAVVFLYPPIPQDG